MSRRASTPSAFAWAILAGVTSAALAACVAIAAAENIRSTSGNDLGLVRRTPTGSYNSARFYSTAGQLEANYDKHHLIPGIEPEQPGDKRVVLSQPSGQWGLQICKDMDFPARSREYASDGY